MQNPRVPKITNTHRYYDFLSQFATEDVFCLHFSNSRLKSSNSFSNSLLFCLSRAISSSFVFSAFERRSTKDCNRATAVASSALSFTSCESVSDWNFSH